MKDRYTYTDFEGAEISVFPWPRDDRVGAVIAWNHAHDGVLIAPDRLDEVVTEVYKAVGKPAPVVIERPEIIPTAQAFAGRIRVRAKGRDVWLVPSENNSYLIEDPRALAAALVAVQEHVEAVDVERVAAFFSEAMDSDPETLARRFLSHFKVEERAS